MKAIITIAAITATLLAQASGTFTLIEVNPLQCSQISIWDDSSKSICGAGELSNFAELNGRLYFGAQDSYDNVELWSTDGTQAGTSLVKEINSNGSANIGNIIRTGNRIIFLASDSLYGDYDLFSSDGTASGTIKIAEFNAYWNGLDTTSSIIFNNHFIFNSTNGLLSLDLSTGSSQILKNTTPFNYSFRFSELNGSIYFIVANDSDQFQLWKTDNTTAGTQFVNNLVTTSPIKYVGQMIAFNGNLYLTASLGGYGTDLFSIDTNGQVQKLVIALGTTANPQQLTHYNDVLYFSASDTNAANIYRITAANPIPQQLVPNSTLPITEHLHLSFANNRAYFWGRDGQYIHTVHLGSLVYQAIHLGNYILPYYWMDNGPLLVGDAGKVFFAAYDTSTGKQVFIEGDEDIQNLEVVMPSGANIEHPFNVWFSCGMSDVFDFKIWNDKVIVPANFNDSGREVWIYEKESRMVTEVKSVKNENKMLLYPNPADEELTVETNSNSYCVQQLRITNMLGEIVMQISFTGNKTSVNLSKLAAGNYCATLSGNGESIQTTKQAVIK